MWHFGIRQLKNGGYLLTEEFPRLQKGGAYAIVGQIEQYTKKELVLLFQDVLQILTKGRIKKTTDDGDFISHELENRRIAKLIKEVDGEKIKKKSS